MLSCGDWKTRRRGRLRAAFVATVALVLPGAGIAAIQGLGMPGLGGQGTWSFQTEVPLPVRATPAARDAALAAVAAAATKREPMDFVVLNPSRDGSPPPTVENASTRTARYATPPDEQDDGGEAPLVPVDLASTAVPSTYKTVCVKLCDGSYVPVSFSTLPDRFANDVERCSNSCDAQTRLFVAASPGASLDDMRDLSGRRYADLPMAYRFRHAVDDACRCNVDAAPVQNGERTRTANAATPASR